MSQGWPAHTQSGAASRKASLSSSHSTDSKPISASRFVFWYAAVRVASVEPELFDRLVYARLNPLLRRFTRASRRSLVGHTAARTRRAGARISAFDSPGAVTPPARNDGMTDQRTTARPQLPHHKLLAYDVALQFLIAVKSAEIRDPKLRDQAMRAAKSAALNTAEAAGRVSRADRARVFAIARGEAMEAAAAVEIAVLARDADERSFDACLAIANRLVALLTGLCR